MATGGWANASYKAVSGKPDKDRKFVYSVERQKQGGVGPIPVGEYWINPSEIWENNWAKSLTTARRSAWGDYRVTIHILPGTNTHGRGGFFIHGGDQAGSAGCIDLTLSMNNFINDLKKYLEDAPNCHIPLTVKYL